jgi:hypothetical protein
MLGIAKPEISETQEISEVLETEVPDEDLATGSTESLGVAAPKLDYRIPDEPRDYGGPKNRFRNNAEAIKTLKVIEAEERLATSEEQEVLSRYIGWGGLPQAFDDHNEQWGKEYGELKELLTEDEYDSARASTLNAHYTSPTVINAVYKTLGNMGLKSGNILEPAMGIGNFFGLLPEEMKENTKLYGVELDSVSGRISQQLYQTANIRVSGFEKTTFPDQFFDAAIGNVPFGG